MHFVQFLEYFASTSHCAIFWEIQKYVNVMPQNALRSKKKE